MMRSGKWMLLLAFPLGLLVLPMLRHIGNTEYGQGILDGVAGSVSMVGILMIADGQLRKRKAPSSQPAMKSND